MEKYAKYACYAFGDYPEAVRVITSFTSQQMFLNNTVPFKSPLPMNTSSLLGFKRDTYIARNQLERSIFELLRVLGKVSFYEYVVDFVREHHNRFVFILGILDNAASIDIDEKKVDRFLEDVRRDFDKKLKQFAYQYLMSIDENAIREWFASTRLMLESCENEVVQFVRSMRDTAAHCCESYARFDVRSPVNGQGEETSTSASSNATDRPPRKMAKLSKTSSPSDTRRRR